MKINPCTSEKSNESEDEKLQLKTIHQTNPSILEHKLNNPFYDPSFFRHISQINYFIFFPFTPLDEDTILNIQEVFF